MSMQEGGHRVRRTLVTTALAGCVTAVTAMPAAAGGWWTYPQLEHRTLAVGESTTVSADLLFASVEAAQEATRSGEYFAHLVRGIDEAGLREAMSTSGPHRGWWSAPDDVIQLAPLTLDRDDSNFGGATASFVVPDVEPGIWDVMLCDRGCSQPLADVVPLRDVYVGDPATIRLIRDAGLETQHLLDQLESVQFRLDGLHDRTGTLSEGVEDLDQRLDGVTTADHRLTASLASLETRIAAGEARAPQPWWAHAGWFVAGAIVALGWTRRGHGPARDAAADERGQGETHDRETASVQPEAARSSQPDLVTFALEDPGAPVR